MNNYFVEANRIFKGIAVSRKLNTLAGKKLFAKINNCNLDIDGVGIQEADVEASHGTVNSLYRIAPFQ